MTYGAPVLPGAMFLLAYFEDGTPVLGLPGCVMYAKSTIFDLMLPRIAAGITVKAEDLYVLGHGGLCLGCEECRFPDCSFGKGLKAIEILKQKGTEWVLIILMRMAMP